MEPLERQIWIHLNPNALTWIGNLPLFVLVGVSIYYGGLQYHDTEPLPSWLFLTICFFVHWFNIFDSLDGCRARRLKCGSGVGRIVDEAGDAVIYTLMAALFGYVYRVPPGWLTLSYGFINVSKYTIEVYYTLSGKFQYCDEYFGALEANFYIATLFFVAGVFGGDIF